MATNISVTTTAIHPAAQLESLGLLTANDVFFRMVELDRAEAMLQQDATGFWQPISAREVYSRVTSLAQYCLRGELSRATGSPFLRRTAGSGR